MLEGLVHRVARAHAGEPLICLDEDERGLEAPWHQPVPRGGKRAVEPERSPLEPDRLDPHLRRRPEEVAPGLTGPSTSSRRGSPRAPASERQPRRFGVVLVDGVFVVGLGVDPHGCDEKEVVHVAWQARCPRAHRLGHALGDPPAPRPM